MSSKVLITGAGQLGSRYLQGLARVSRPLTIYVQDVSLDSLQRAEARWREVIHNETPHQVLFIETYADLPTSIDIVIVATVANVRSQVVLNIARSTEVQYWVLEKVLAQNEQAITEMQAVVKNAKGAWVNKPMRIMEWHQAIKSQIDLAGALKFSVRGGAWGLACNAVHYLDLLSWWAGEELQRIDTKGLEQKWIASKRLGFWEVNGTLSASYSRGTVATLLVDETSQPLIIRIEEDNLSWVIHEADGIAVRSDGLEILGRFSFQSELTAGLVESLLDAGKCGLPTFAESAELHRVFLSGMLAHWNRHMRRQDVSLPIT